MSSHIEEMLAVERRRSEASYGTSELQRTLDAALRVVEQEATRPPRDEVPPGWPSTAAVAVPYALPKGHGWHEPAATISTLGDAFGGESPALPVEDVDGVTDNSAAIRAYLMRCIELGVKAVFPKLPNPYVINSAMATITLSEGQELWIEGRGWPEFKASVTSPFSVIGEQIATLSFKAPTSSSDPAVTVGQRHLPINGASGTVRPGDVLHIDDKLIALGTTGWEGYVQGDVHRVENVSSDGIVTIQSPKGLEFSHWRNSETLWTAVGGFDPSPEVFAYRSHNVPASDLECVQNGVVNPYANFAQYTPGSDAAGYYVRVLTDPGDSIVVRKKTPLAIKVYRGGRLTVHGIKTTLTASAQGSTFFNLRGLDDVMFRSCDFQATSVSTVDGVQLEVCTRPKARNIISGTMRYNLLFNFCREIRASGLYGNGTYSLISISGFSSDAISSNVTSIDAVSSATDAHPSFDVFVDGMVETGSISNQRCEGGGFRNCVITSTQSANLTIGQVFWLDNSAINSPYALRTASRPKYLENVTVNAPTGAGAIGYGDVLRGMVIARNVVANSINVINSTVKPEGLELLVYNCRLNFVKIRGTVSLLIAEGSEVDYIDGNAATDPNRIVAIDRSTLGPANPASPIDVFTKIGAPTWEQAAWIFSDSVFRNGQCPASPTIRPEGVSLVMSGVTYQNFDPGPLATSGLWRAYDVT